MTPQTTNPRPFTAPSVEYDDGLFFPSEVGPTELGADAPLVSRQLIRESLADYFALDLEVYVGAGIPWYADRGSRNPYCTPDTFVAFGVRFGERAAWHPGREGVVPAVCVYVETPGNQGEVLGRWKDRCEGLGVKEYIVFDPDRIRGFRLHGGRYRAIRLGGDGGIRSRALGLRLVSEYGYPRFVEIATGEVVLTRREQALRSVQGQRANAARV